jgi:hypothetical protein
MKRIAVMLSLLVIFGMLLGACATPTPETIVETVEVPVMQTQIVEQTKVVMETQVVEVTPEAAPGMELPREETLYFNGQQWDPVKC